MNTTFELYGMPLSPAIIATYFPLFLGILAQLKFERKIALSLGAIATLMALLGGLIGPLALPGILLLVLACDSLTRYPKFALVSAVVLFVLSVAIFLHKLPGFNNPILLEQHQLTKDSIPYTLYLNFDKAILGLILLSFMQQPATRGYSSNKWQILGISLTTSVLAFTIALIGGLVAWSPKWFGFFTLWALSNLFITCVAEEAFFRGFIQRGLQQQLKQFNKPQILSVVFTALLFGAVHAVGGPLFIALATLMGFGYGYVYFKTNQLRWAIAFHFIFNCIHITLFSYPKLL